MSVNSGGKRHWTQRKHGSSQEVQLSQPTYNTEGKERSSNSDQDQVFFVCPAKVFFLKRMGSLNKGCPICVWREPYSRIKNG